MVIGLLPPVQTAFAAPTLEILLKSSVATAPAGQTFTYSLSYRCASITENCQNVTVTDTLPPELTYVAPLGTTQDITSATYDAATRKVLFNFVSPLPAGSTGTLTISVAFNNGTTLNNTVASNTATISASNATPVTSNKVDVTGTASTSYTVAKALTAGGAVGEPTTYRLRLTSPATGGLNLSGVVFTDTLPAGTTFISATNGGTYDAVTGKVTWNIGNVTLPSPVIDRYVTVSYDAPTFAVNQTVINKLDITGIPYGQVAEVSIGTSSPSRKLTGGAAKATHAKNVSDTTLTVGQTGYYYFSGTNSGSVTLDNFTIEDAPLPNQIEVTSITAGLTSAATPTTISYTTNKQPGYVTNGLANPYTTNTTVTVASLNLTAGEYITGLKWEYGTVDPGFSIGTSPRINFKAINPDHAGNNVITGQTVTNCSKITYLYNSTSGSSTNACKDFGVISPVAEPVAAKSETSTGPYYPGSTVTYRLRATNKSTATANLDNPIVMDLLPASLQYVSYTYSRGSMAVGTPAPTFEKIDSYGTTGQTLLRWSWSGVSMPVSKYMDILLTVKVNPGTVAGAINNTMALTTNSSPNICAVADTNDLDGDGSITDFLCTNTSTIVSVTSAATLDSKKLVKGQLDSTYSLSGKTIQGGTADYRLLVTNTGTVAVKNILVIDILPFIGDTGVVDYTSPRGSAWRPTLVGAVTAPLGVTVYYSTQQNPCRPELVASGPAGCTAAGWTTVLPADPTSVQTLKFDFGSIVLNPNQSLQLDWPMRAPVGTAAGLKAWNSFGYVATRNDNNQTFLASEPVKVDIQVDPSSNAAYGDFVWVDTNQNGIQDGGETGLNGVQVQLFQTGPDNQPGTADDVLVDTTLTGNDAGGNPGYYLFPDLAPGNYFAKFTLPGNYAFTVKNGIGSNGSNDSDADSTTGITSVTNLGVGENDLSWDAGLYQVAVPTTPVPTPTTVVTPTPTTVVTPTPEPTTVATPTPDPTTVVTPTPDPTTVATPTPDPTTVATPTPDPTTVATPTTVVTPTPDPTTVATPTPEPTTVATPTTVVTPTPDPTTVATPTPDPTTVATPTPDPTTVATPTPDPTTVATPTTVVTPTPDPTTVATPTPDPTTAATPTTVATPTPDPTTVATPTPDPTTLATPTPEPTTQATPTTVPTTMATPTTVVTTTTVPTTVVTTTPVPTTVVTPTPDPTTVATPTTVVTPAPDPTTVATPTPDTQSTPVVTTTPVPSTTVPPVDGAPNGLPNPAATTAVPGVSIVDPTLFKTVDKNMAVKGDTVTFTITASNPGKEALAKVTVVDNVPLPFIVQSASSPVGKVSINGQVVTADLGSLAGGARVDIQIVTIVGDGADGEVVNTATLTSVQQNSVGSQSSGDSDGEGRVFSMGAKASVVIGNGSNNPYPKLPNTGSGTHPTDGTGSIWWLLASIGLTALCLTGGRQRLQKTKKDR